MKAASPARAMWLIARLRLQRLWNLLAGFSFRAKKGGKSRAATPGKKRVGLLFTSLIGIAMLFSLANLARESVINMQCYLAPASECMIEASTDSKRRLDRDIAAVELKASPFDEAVARALTMQLSLLFVVSILLPLSSREIAHADWDLEWLVTLPAERTTLLWGRILERTLVNPTGWLLLTPVCALIGWYSGLRWSAPLAGIAAALVLLQLAALLRTLADTGLRMWLAPSQLRNLQALTAIASMPLMYLAIGFGSMNSGSPILHLARAFPSWVMWTPPGLLVRLLNAGSGAAAGQILALLAAGQILALLAAQSALACWLGMQLLRYQLRNGVVASGSRESGRRPKPAASTSESWLARLLPASPIKRRELRLLSRDRNFLIQSLLLPLIIVGSQLAFTGSPDALADLADSPKFVAGMAFGIGSYMLMLSAFQTLNNEGQSLWMLYTFPRPLESVLKEKTEFWAVLALVYPVTMLGAALWYAPAHTTTLLGMAAVVLAGIPIFSVIAVSLGVFACDPLAQETRHKIKPSYTYLYMMLSGIYVFAVTSGEWAQKLVLIILMASLGLALWQKARDQLPYLLDPTVAPPARVSTADGLIAALLFFILQGAIFIGLVKLASTPVAEAMVLAFSISGMMVYAIMRLVYLLAKTSGVPAMLRQNAAQALVWGLGGGAAAAAVGLAYLAFAQAWQLLPAAGPNQFDTKLLFAMAVLAAPLCEEFIFRGLVFGGLRRSMGLAPAMLMSAALFAIVHPPVSMLPVFVLGLGAAYVYERTRALLAPVLLHAVYNAAVLAWQLPL